MQTATPNLAELMELWPQRSQRRASQQVDLVGQTRAWLLAETRERLCGPVVLAKRGDKLRHLQGHFCRGTRVWITGEAFETMLHDLLLDLLDLAGFSTPMAYDKPKKSITKKLSDLFKKRQQGHQVDSLSPGIKGLLNDHQIVDTDELLKRLRLFATRRVWRLLIEEPKQLGLAVMRCRRHDLAFRDQTGRIVCDGAEYNGFVADVIRAWLIDSHLCPTDTAAALVGS